LKGGGDEKIFPHYYAHRYTFDSSDFIPSSSNREFLIPGKDEGLFCFPPAEL